MTANAELEDRNSYGRPYMAACPALDDQSLAHGDRAQRPRRVALGTEPADDTPTPGNVQIADVPHPGPPFAVRKRLAGPRECTAHVETAIRIAVFGGYQCVFPAATWPAVYGSAGVRRGGAAL